MNFSGENTAGLPRLFDAFGFGTIALGSAIFVFLPEALHSSYDIDTTQLALIEALSFLITGAVIFVSYILGVIVYFFGYSIRNKLLEERLTAARQLIDADQADDRVWHQVNEMKRKLLFLDSSIGCFALVTSLSCFAFFAHGQMVIFIYLFIVSIVAAGVSFLAARIASLEISLVLSANRLRQRSDGVSTNWEPKK